MSRLRRDADRISAFFKLSYRELKPERANVKRRYGACTSDGVITIRLTHAKSGKPLRYSSLIDTLCHELAHLRHFNHGPEFKAFFMRLLGWARREGIYRPRKFRSGWNLSSVSACEPLSWGLRTEYMSQRASLISSGPIVPKRNGVSVFSTEKKLQIATQTRSEKKTPPLNDTVGNFEKTRSPAAEAPRQLSLFDL